MLQSARRIHHVNDQSVHRAVATRRAGGEQQVRFRDPWNLNPFQARQGGSKDDD